MAEGAPAGATGAIGGGITKFTGLLLDYVAPIGAFLAGYGMGDFLQLAGLINGFIPKALAQNTLINLSGLFGAIAYFVIGYILSRFVPYLGRTALGLFLGCGLNVLFGSFTGRLANMKPA
jgi:hypothetical protein